MPNCHMKEIRVSMFVMKGVLCLLSYTLSVKRLSRKDNVRFPLILKQLEFISLFQEKNICIFCCCEWLFITLEKEFKKGNHWIY